MARPGRELVLYTLGWFLASFALWLWFVDSLALAEVWVGLAVAALATVLALAVWLFSPVRFRPRVRWARLLSGVPLGVLRDSGILALALWRRLARGERPRSAFRLVPFSGVGDDPESVTWRAFAIVGTSITPNTYVIGVDRERKAALVHQLVPDESAARVRRRVVGADSA